MSVSVSVSVYVYGRRTGGSSAAWRRPLPPCPSSTSRATTSWRSPERGVGLKREMDGLSAQGGAISGVESNVYEECFFTDSGIRHSPEVMLDIDMLVLETCDELFDIPVFAESVDLREGGSAPERDRHSTISFPPHASVQWQPDGLTVHTKKWFLGAGLLGAPPMSVRTQTRR